MSVKLVEMFISCAGKSFSNKIQWKTLVRKSFEKTTKQKEMKRINGRFSAWGQEISNRVDQSLLYKSQTWEREDNT